MKIGQTSILVFVFKLIGSALGFLSTLYFARELGAEVLGLYAVVLTVVGWLAFVGELGVGKAMTKRISEAREEAEFFSAAILFILASVLVISIFVLLLRSVLQRYISEFDAYVSIPVAWVVVGILAIHLFYKITTRVLRGQKLVYLAGLLDELKVGGQSLVQIMLVLLGYGLLGMLVGYAIGGIAVGLIGLYWIKIDLKTPGKRHFRSLFDYAKFSWLGGLKARAFNQIDILILGVFVPSAVIGVYSVAWSIAKFLDLFGSAVRETVFPEISYSSANESKQAAASMIEDALSYTGLIATPGLVGGGILGERLLMLYGDEFVEGAAVLWLLILAVLIYSFQKQLINGLNGIDRPDLAFRTNAAFVVVNASLNLVLIWQYGVVGAAAATALSTVVALVLSYYYLSRLITFRVPYGELVRQWAAALLMGTVVFATLGAIEATALIIHNAIVVVGLVAIGVGVYFLSLLSISREFRATVARNLPFELPFLS
jgi:O-antigen/teichoic acid export membrane protein